MLSGEGNAGERWKTTICLINKKATLLVQHAFFVHFFAVVLHDYNVKLPGRNFLVTRFMEKMSYFFSFTFIIKFLLPYLLTYLLKNNLKLTLQSWRNSILWKKCFCRQNDFTFTWLCNSDSQTFTVHGELEEKKWPFHFGHSFSRVYCAYICIKSFSLSLLQRYSHSMTIFFSLSYT